MRERQHTAVYKEIRESLYQFTANKFKRTANCSQSEVMVRTAFSPRESWGTPSSHPRMTRPTPYNDSDLSAGLSQVIAWQAEEVTHDVRDEGRSTVARRARKKVEGP
jgi:hypothetical protein